MSVETGDEPSKDVFIIRLGPNGAARNLVDPSGRDSAGTVLDPEWDVRGASCASYAPGHNVHFIQVKLAIPTPAERVQVLSVDGPRMLVTVDEGHEPEVWMCHDPSILQLAILENGGPVVAFLHGHGLLRFQSYLFYPARDPDKWNPCDLC